jgi:hypothetical protein
VSATAKDQYGNTVASYTGTPTLSNNFGTGHGTPLNGTFSNAFVAGEGSSNPNIVAYAAETNRTVTVTDGAASGTSNTFTVQAAGAESLAVTGPSTAALGAATTYTVSAKDHWANTATSYGGNVAVTSSDSAFVPTPSSKALSAGSGTFSIKFNTLGSQTLAAHDTVNGSIAAPNFSVNVTAGMPGSTYHMISPVRVLDTRPAYKIGYSAGKLHPFAPITWQVTGSTYGIPAGASGVTGNVTVTNATFAWAVYVGPDPIAHPTSSTVNFVGGETTGNGLTVALSSAGKLSATFLSNGNNTVDLVFDVTGYFTADDTGASFHPINPVRSLDTRNKTGGLGKFTSNTPQSWQIAGNNGIPSNAIAVTGNVTVVNSTFSWAIYLGPNPVAHPTTSALNFLAHEIKANSVTVGLSSAGKLSATYISIGGQTTDLVFDVTGYYTAGAGGSKWVPMTPIRVLDTRSGGGMIPSNTPRKFQVTGVGGSGAVPFGATAVTGNVTVTNETTGWAVFVGPDPNPSPSTSSINFTYGDIKANGMTVRVGSDGSLSATYISIPGQKTHLVFDVTGYFI